jgi:hypothetical protein
MRKTLRETKINYSKIPKNIYNNTNIPYLLWIKLEYY